MMKATREVNRKGDYSEETNMMGRVFVKTREKFCKEINLTMKGF